MPSNTQTFPLNHYQAPTKNAMIHREVEDGAVLQTWHCLPRANQSPCASTIPSVIVSTTITTSAIKGYVPIWNRCENFNCISLLENYLQHKRVDQIICKLLWLLIAWGMFRRSRSSYDCQFQLQCKFNSRQSDPERNHSHHWYIDTELLPSDIDNDWDHGRLFVESWFWDNGQPFIHCKLYRVFFFKSNHVDVNGRTLAKERYSSLN